MNNTPKLYSARLALSDGLIFYGHAIGVPGTVGGECCFNTSMTGYQEIFTDPSYYGQLMVMTYPHIGNYGTAAEDDEASNVMISGLIIRSFTERYSNPSADASLRDYMETHQLTGIQGIDTRQLVKHIREKGVMNAVISTEDVSDEELVKKAKEWPLMAGLELSQHVTRQEAQSFPAEGESNYKVAVMDYGVKKTILEQLRSRGCSLRVFPAQTPLEGVKEWGPDGVFLSNGPGDPNATAPFAAPIMEWAKKEKKPLFGICLGHQLMALSEGCSVDKMFVGHRGANQPVQNLSTKLVEITTQNHGFAVKEDEHIERVATVTHKNLNDGSIEGLRFKEFTGFCIQYHPEASPGPHDSRYLFDEFVKDLAASNASVASNSSN
ncbi:MAG: carbamoyl-phosphate synthase small subunit [Rhodothermaceae bacterium TMED105]|nr:MAG: carbamoyl-phosphate synthase small subunit [Rhodothermaceae bacterium TMED105]